MSSLHEQAEAAEAIGQLQNALELWERICRTAPDPLTLCKLGRLRKKVGQWRSAEEALQAALAIDPKFAHAMVYLGILNLDREDIDQDLSTQEAISWLERAITLEPSASTYTLLGVAFCDIDNPNSARQAFERAINIDDRYEEAYFNLAGLPGTDLKRQRHLYQKAVELDPCYALAHQQLGVVEHKLRNFATAEYHFRRAVELDIVDVFSHLYLANLLAVKRDTKGAEAEFRAAIAVDSADHIKDTAEFFAVFLDGEGRHAEAAKIRSGGPPTLDQP